MWLGGDSWGGGMRFSKNLGETSNISLLTFQKSKGGGGGKSSWVRGGLALNAAIIVLEALLRTPKFGMVLVRNSLPLASPTYFLAWRHGTRTSICHSGR